MNKYELVYIIDAHAPQSTKDEIAKQVADAMAKAEIKVTGNQLWLERHKMSFPINKIIEGSYYLLNLEAKSSSIPKLHSILRINEQILRFLTVKAEAPKAV
jgi:small subunit ribosomal protein S6